LRVLLDGLDDEVHRGHLRRGRRLALKLSTSERPLDQIPDLPVAGLSLAISDSASIAQIICRY
jgi:hypothetical protein